MSRVRIRVRDVQAAACAVLGLPPEAMTSERRWVPWVLGRQMAMAVAMEVTGRSSLFVARRFGHRDHTTLLHARRQVAARVAADPAQRALFHAIAEAAEDRARRWHSEMRRLAAQPFHIEARP